MIRNNHITGPGSEALSLYLLLVTVGDADGVSWYSTGLIARLLLIEPRRVARARGILEQYELIVFDSPFYQVLSLEPSLNVELSGLLAGAERGGAA